LVSIPETRHWRIAVGAEETSAIYQPTAAYGHFGRELPTFTWERTDRVADLKSAAGA
jgi:S-adenosylmethionine synthetase